MTKAQITRYNEALAVRKIREAYISDGITEAMALCQTYMGIDLKAAYNKACGICFDLIPKEVAT